jgi:hypothetical protein
MILCYVLQACFANLICICFFLFRMIGIADPVMVTGIALALANPERVDLMAESDGVLNINVSTLIEHRV